MRRLSALLFVMAVSQSAATALRLDLGRNGPDALLLVGGASTGEYAEDLCPPGEHFALPGAIANAVYLVDTATGLPLWVASGAPDAVDRYAGVPVLFHPHLSEPVVAAVTPVDSDGNGVTDRAYVVDTGGTLWRLDLPEAGPQFAGDPGDVVAAYSMTPVAELGGEGRRFVQQADYVRSRDASGDYDGILLVSGAWPGSPGGGNYAYLVKDRGGSPVSHDQLPDITAACGRRENAECQSADLRPGWKLALGSAGELGVSRPLVSRGVVYFSTWLPPLDLADCDVEAGEGLVYAVALADGSPLETAQEGPAVPTRVFEAGPGRPGPVLPSGDGVSLPGAAEEGGPQAGPRGALRWRIYWREEGVDLP